MARVRKSTQADRADRHDLYQRAVQAAEPECEFIADTFKQLRRRAARSIREDFCGTALVATEWVRRYRSNTAIGVDLDPEVLAWGTEHNLGALRPTQRERIRLIESDVLSVRTPPVDAVLAMNFSYWLLKDRLSLRNYFKRVQRALVADGVFFLDAFGGYDAYKVIREKTEHKGFTYIWRQASYHPVTGECACHIDFRFPDGSQLRPAFSYTWRIWSLPEIRELLAEVGFSRVTVHWQGYDERTGEPNGIFSPTETGEPDAGWIAYVVAEK
jgi:cyclopropane fatty-acyl-phospholipid synthase-like methyltransferase